MNYLIIFLSLIILLMIITCYLFLGLCVSYMLAKLNPDKIRDHLRIGIVIITWPYQFIKLIVEKKL